MEQIEQILLGGGEIVKHFIHVMSIHIHELVNIHYSCNDVGM